MKSAFLSPKGPWLLVLAVFVLFACLVAAQTTPSIAAWPYWPAVKLAAQGVVLLFLVLLVFHAVKVDVSIEPTTGSNSCNSLAANYAGGSLANSLQQHRQNLELQAIQTVAQAALLNGQRKAGEMARAAIDQLLGTGSLEYAKAALDESARTSASINQAFAAMQACTCTGNQACSNCPPQRFSPVQTPRAADKEAVIQDKGETATHITPADIEASIASEAYFTAHDGATGAREAHAGQAQIIRHTEAAVEPALRLLTFCVLVLRNGTKVVGVNYGAIDPARHDPEMGRTEARKAAIEQIWPLMGYELRTKLATATT